MEKPEKGTAFGLGVKFIWVQLRDMRYEVVIYAEGLRLDASARFPISKSVIRPSS